MSKELLVVIVGPTAVGKTEIAIEVSRKIDAEIISADSMQIYRYMNIGTAKPTLEERKGIIHYMIDIINPDEIFSAADFQARAKDCIENIHRRNKIPLMTGGTGFYINSVCYDYAFSDAQRDDSFRKQLQKQARQYGNQYLYEKLEKLDPVGAKKIHPNNLRRIIRAIEVSIKTGKPFSYYEEETKKQESPYDLLMYGLTRPRKELYQRINQRVVNMINAGFVEEVKRLLKMGYGPELNSMQGLGYRQIIDYLYGKTTLNEAINLISRDTRRYAKRQYTWFLRDRNIVWLDVSKEGKEKIISNIVKDIEGKLKNT
ncbi:MAG: tRNA (adenosine(37)-N6)-dimethylallyltransferase MiaA [Tepidanaerobacteraceae bacterium]|jgi:tRNA dimethylallyltransferase|nr:tRNA (adenosine(37)-N6)-dimethylallyltransferase MiaA [Tepidanaerobacter sp.]HQA60343.1 tRNA (adenosine(37)-N6)-dimethylallyltransferase MiaA [Tepidanaerobacteraceae bacterium]HQE05739.1 tRNA (adenosine(37)-N6)-dimethylallyltransferase MiaA [Tepidanaerobacteraceae bacterium]